MSAAAALRFEPVGKWLLGAAGAALGFCLAGAWLNPQQFFRSYLVAYLFWIGLSLGSFALVMLHHLVAGRWGFVIQRLLEAAVGALPLMALLFLPVLLGARELYPWASLEIVSADPRLQDKSLYLNVPFFIARAVLYFALWIFLGHLLCKWSQEQDLNSEVPLARRLQRLSGPGLLVYGLTVTFSALDWGMSLEPHWYSTIYGLMFMVGDAISALAFATILAGCLAEREPLAALAAPEQFHDLGNLLLALVMLWAYLSLSQFLIIWMENLPEEIPWYFHRGAGSWGVVALVLVLAQFALPFALLLSRGAKRRPDVLAGIGLLILGMRWLDLFWLLAPAFHPEGYYFHWLDLSAFLMVGALWAAVFLWRLAQNSLLPLGDPRLPGLNQRAQEV